MGQWRRNHPAAGAALVRLNRSDADLKGMGDGKEPQRRWNREMLAPLLRNLFGDQPMVIASNREPWIHSLSEDGEGLIVQRPASGLVSALEPLLEAAGGTWIAHGAGSADRLVVDGHDAVALPPQQPRYRLRRLWLHDGLIEGYYANLANRGLWPLCHLAFVAPEFEPDDWCAYRQVNHLFAEAILAETAGVDQALVFLQDFHLALVPQLLRQARPSLTLAQFWHVPWPHPEQLRACPYSAELIEGLLHNDLLGFQTHEHCQHFLAAVEQLRWQQGGDGAADGAADGEPGLGGISLRSISDRDGQRGEPPMAGHVTQIGSFPISIDFDAWNAAACDASLPTAIERWRGLLALDGQRLGIGIDRLDYTKGLRQRLRAVDRLLERQPHWCGRFCFLQLLTPSRNGIDDYRLLGEEIEQQVARINNRWRQGTWQPLSLLGHRCDRAELVALYRLADFCLVSSLEDGMNLVAKEFVASRCDGDGVLILSRYTGSARDLADGALLINPFAIDELALAIDAALMLEEPRRRWRMARMRRQVCEHNVYHWAARILTEIAQTQQRSPAAAAAGSAPGAGNGSVRGVRTAP